MIKRTIALTPPVESRDPAWLLLDEAAEVEVTSEHAEHPIEAALLPGRGEGWIAASSGEQTVRLRFHLQHAIQQVRVVFEERERERTQEFVLRAALNAQGPWRELVRQQFTFSPAGSTREEEDYRVNLPAVAALELTIVPDIRGGDARATLKQFRLA